MPSPSQPSNRKIRLGMKISRSIERTKIRTRSVKRGRKGSVDIYERENRSTFPEINRMIDLNSVEVVSKRMGRVIWCVVSVNKFHSSNVMLDLMAIRLARRKEGSERDRRRRGAVVERGNIA